MQLSLQEVPEWPPLAWIARCRPRAEVVEVFHGPQLETGKDWCVEGAWDGEFETTGFDVTDVMAGSGARLREGSVVFAAAANTVDRLVSFTSAKETLVSNSMVCLLSQVDGSLDPTYLWYYEDFLSIIHGLRGYQKTLRTSAGEVKLEYFCNLVWNGDVLLRAEKPRIRRGFGDYEEYAQFLRSTMARVARNAGSTRRRFPYSLLATTSGGYDSTAVSVLARGAGCTETICFDKARTGAREGGAEVAAALGLSVIPVSRDAWRRLPFPEIPFIAADANGESVLFAGAGHALRQRALVTGFHGDKMWAKDVKDLSENVVRGDASGLSLTEYRLWQGFLNVAVPFWAVRQIRDVNMISRSEPMKGWDLGGDYSRPICRRLAEEAGVPREAFGRAKRAAAVGILEPLTGPSWTDYLGWLRQNRSQWVKRGRIPPFRSVAFDQGKISLKRTRVSVLRKLPYLWRAARSGPLGRPTGLRRHFFPWAIERAAARYSPLARHLRNDRRVV